ncbi:MAG TPA: hypothetical protein VMO47_01975 [Rhodothermales bacterium]|nr:hypothetical protein [Rhodothermales bacterium]
MRTSVQAGLLSILLMILSGGLNTSDLRAQDPFVRVEDGHFVLDGRYYYFTGINYWYGMNLGSEGVGGDRSRLLMELDSLAARGLTNLRVMASSEGPNSEPWRVKPAVQPAPREYDEDLLKGLDFLLAEMGKRGMKAVLVLNNFFHWSGGMAQYVSWTTGTPIPYPSFEQGGNSWDDLQNYSSRFYANFEAQRLFLDYVFELIHRENHINGALYRDDPTIMAWQLANEPRGFAHSDEYVDWVDKAAGFIQLHDPNHLVSLGGEGKLVPSNGTQFEWVSTSPYLDYITIHVWIENWGWFHPTRAGETFATAVGRAMGYLADHVSLARAINKPMVLEEFGASRDGGSFDISAGTTYRDQYYRMMLEALYKLAQEGNVAAGSNVWSWSGPARPVTPGEPWQEGEPFTGDPPHEKQGWYSIYDTDESTLDLLTEYSRLMSELNVPLSGSVQEEAPEGK